MLRLIFILVLFLCQISTSIIDQDALKVLKFLSTKSEEISEKDLIEALVSCKRFCKKAKDQRLWQLLLEGFNLTQDQASTLIFRHQLDDFKKEDVKLVTFVDEDAEEDVELMPELPMRIFSESNRLLKPKHLVPKDSTFAKYIFKKKGQKYGFNPNFSSPLYLQVFEESKTGQNLIIRIKDTQNTEKLLAKIDLSLARFEPVSVLIPAGKYELSFRAMCNLKEDFVPIILWIRVVEAKSNYE